MCAAKSPISILQEFTMRKRISMPVYDIVSQGFSFVCRGVVDDIVISTVAESKQRAKHSCAEQLCLRLGLIKFTSPQTNSNCNNINLPVSFKNDTNFIGQLNELCSKYGKEMPRYDEAGCVNQKFRIECKCLTYATFGEGPTKKQAKQESAEKMLNRIKVDDFVIPNPIQVTTHKTCEFDDKVIETFKGLRIEKKTQTEIGKITLIPNETYRIKIETETPTRIPETETELKAELKRMGIIYRLFDLQSDSDSVVLTLKAQSVVGGDSYTFLHADTSHQAAVLELLKQTVTGIKLLQK